MDTTSDHNVTAVLGDFIVSTSFANIPEEAWQTAKRAITDCIGVTVAGSETRAGQIVADFIREMGGKPRATVIGKGFKSSVLLAALANGVMAHALDFDDSNRPMRGHPSAPLIPALLAVGEDRGISGRQVLEAYVIGFEIESRIGRGVNIEHNVRGWHSTSTLGTFGSTAGVGKILGLNKQQMITAFGIACSEASGVKENFGTMTKPFHCGNAARNGITAALLAQKGFSASTKALEGAFGFCSLFCGQGNYNLKEISDDLGDPFEIVSPGVIIKPHPCCGSTHTSIDALKNIIQAHHFQAEEVESIEAGVSYARKKNLSYDDPKTVLQAKFSMPFCLAVTCLDGGVKLSQFEESKLSDPRVRKLMEKITMYVHPDMQDKSGLSQEFALVKVRLKDGREYVEKVEDSKRKGSKLNPLSWEELTSKYIDCAQRVLNEAVIDRSLEILERLEDVTNIRELMTLYNRS